MITDASPAAIAGATFAAMLAAHRVADYWGQTDHQAAHKGRPGWEGRIACARHVTTYTLTCLGAVLGTAATLGHLHQLHPATLAAATAINASTHYWADRRTTLARLAKSVGLGRFYALGTPRPGHDDNPTLGAGAHELDQSFHILFLFISGLVTAIPV